MRKIIFSFLSFTGLSLYASSAFAGGISCLTGEVTRFGTPADPSVGKCDSRETTRLMLLDDGDKALNEYMSKCALKIDLSADSDFTIAESKVLQYCPGGPMPNKESCDYGRKQYLDVLAWKFINKYVIDCKWLRMVSTNTQELIKKNPYRFLKKGRFNCGPDSKQLCGLEKRILYNPI